MKRMILAVLIISAAAILIYGCDGGGGSPTSPSFTITPGRWTGSNIQFNVSQDGSKLTSQGSSLERNASLILGYVSYSGPCSDRVKFGYTVDIPIENLSFEYNSSRGVVVKGKFSSSTSASGTYSFSVNNPGLCSAGTVSGSGNWSASPR